MSTGNGSMPGGCSPLRAVPRNWGSAPGCCCWPNARRRAGPTMSRLLMSSNIGAARPTLLKSISAVSCAFAAEPSSAATATTLPASYCCSLSPRKRSARASWRDSKFKSKPALCSAGARLRRRVPATCLRRRPAATHAAQAREPAHVRGRCLVRMQHTGHELEPLEVEADGKRRAERRRRGHCEAIVERADVALDPLATSVPSGRK